VSHTHRGVAVCEALGPNPGHKLIILRKEPANYEASCMRALSAKAAARSHDYHVGEIRDSTTKYSLHLDSLFV